MAQELDKAVDKGLHETRRRRRAPPEQRRAQILEAALRCFSEKGYHESTMDDLVRASGLSKGSLYWHFRSKEEVFLALFDGFSVELFHAWDRAAATPTRMIELLRRVGEISIERITAHRPLLLAWAEFLVHREVQERFAAVYRASRAKLAGWVERGIEAGELRPLPAASVAAALIAAVEGLLLQAMVDPDFDPERHWPVLWEALSRGIAR